MRNRTRLLLIALCFAFFSSCSQNNGTNPKKEETILVDSSEPHRYGGWYCPDNLNGFPAVDISNWQKVLVVNGRMATKEEAQNGTSLIFVDQEKYPNAKALDMTMPRLARFYNRSSNREELIIVIQAINVTNDSIVGFRYLNGGNGSARLNEVTFLSDNEIDLIPKSRFVSFEVNINATPKTVQEVLTNKKYAATLQPIFDSNNQLKKDWREASNVNFKYAKSGKASALYAEVLFGNFYIQNDYEELHYNEKFLLLSNEETKSTNLKIVCGPYGDDFESQKKNLNAWAQKVKILSEKE